MALLTVKKTGKASEAATFTPEEAPTATSEIVVPTGLELKVESTLTVTSIVTEGNAKLNLTKPFSMTGVKAITTTGETVITVSGTGELRCTGAGGTTQEIKTGGADLKILRFNGSGTTKYKLLDALTVGTEISLKAGLITTGNFNVTTPKVIYESATAKEWILGSSTLKLTGTGTVWNDLTFNLTVTGETSTIECTGATVAFSFSTVGINALTFTGKTVTMEGSGGPRVKTLNLNLTGAEREVKWQSGAETPTFEVATAITKTAGTQKWVSTTSGTAFKLKKSAGGVSLEEIELKDSKAEGAAVPFTIVNGVDLLGNTNWTIEASATTGHVVGVV